MVGLEWMCHHHTALQWTGALLGSWLLSLKQLHDPTPYGIESANFETYTSYSDEAFEDTYRQIALLHKAGFGQPSQFISVIGSFGAPLTILSTLELPPEGKVVFFDLNPEAILYANITMKLISSSRGPAQFLSMFFARDAEQFERLHGSITVHNQDEFLRIPAQPHLRAQMLSLLSDEEAAFWTGVVAPLYGNFSSNAANRLWPAFDSRWANVYQWFSTGALQTASTSAFRGDDPPSFQHNNSLFYGFGWLASVGSFESVKRKLKFVRLAQQRLHDVVGEFEPCKLRRGSKTVVFAMDMMQDGKFTEYEELWKKKTCGQPLAWLNSHPPDMHSLCLLVDQDWNNSPCGRWDVEDAVVHSMTIRAVSHAIRGVGVNPKADEQFPSKVCLWGITVAADLMGWSLEDVRRWSSCGILPGFAYDLVA